MRGKFIETTAHESAPLVPDPADREVEEVDITVPIEARYLVKFAWETVPHRDDYTERATANTIMKAAPQFFASYDDAYSWATRNVPHGWAFQIDRWYARNDRALPRAEADAAVQD